MKSYSTPDPAITKVEELEISYGRYTYADYLTWQFDEMVELIKGKIFKMSPAPVSKHQRILSYLHREIAVFLKNKSCEIFPAPFDVRLPLKGADDKNITTVVQPDICIICDPEKIDEKGCIGAPDLIIEILSPRTAKKDLTDKKEIYEEAGVKEYWIVEPNEQFIMVYLLENGSYSENRNYFYGDIIKSEAVSELIVDLKEVFEENVL